MSISVTSKVWESFPSGGSELLAMLALADWASDDGLCWPSVAAISAKIRLSRAQTQRVVHGLIDSGFVTVVGNAAGGPPGASRKYRISLAKLTGFAPVTGCIDATGSAHETGRIQAQDGSHGCDGRGLTDATQTTSEPSTTVIGREQAPSSPKLSKKKTGTTLKSFLERCKEIGEKPITEDDTIFDYANKVGIEYEMLSVAWGEFKSRYLPTTKLQKDWRAHFRNAVRRNWYGLWFLKEGEAARWTTAGEQAKREAA